MNDETKDNLINYIFVGIIFLSIAIMQKFKATGFSVIVFFIDCQIFGIISISRKRIVLHAFRLYRGMAIFASIFIMLFGLVVFVGYFIF